MSWAPQHASTLFGESPREKWQTVNCLILFHRNFMEFQNEGLKNVKDNFSEFAVNHVYLRSNNPMNAT